MDSTITEQTQIVENEERFRPFSLGGLIILVLSIGGLTMLVDALGYSAQGEARVVKLSKLSSLEDGD